MGSDDSGPRAPLARVGTSAPLALTVRSSPFLATEGARNEVQRQELCIPRETRSPCRLQAGLFGGTSRESFGHSAHSRVRR